MDKNTQEAFEFNTFYANSGTAEYCFGLDIFDLYNQKEISAMIKNPMAYNQQLRTLSNQLYSANGLYTQCVDYCMALPTLDYVVIPKGKSSGKKKSHKSLMDSALKSFHHKEIMRDALMKSMVDGVAFYYTSFTSQRNLLKSTLDNYQVEQILEINEMGINMSVIPLPADFTKIVGRRNSVYVLAFNLEYFRGLDSDTLVRKLKLYPDEIRQGWNRYDKQGGDNWIVLDYEKTIVSKVRSKIEEAWGRPLCLAAIKNILYSSYFNDTKRATLDDINNRIIFQTLPEGKDKGSCALTKTQQEDQHNKVKQAVLTKNHRNSTSFFTVSAGTKLDQITSDTSIFDEKMESSLQDDIGVDLGFMANLLSGKGSGNYSAQTNNLNLLLSEVFMWIENIAAEYVKVINANIIKDKNNAVDLYYLPCSIITREKFTTQMKDLYLQGSGSLTAWVASTGINADAYFTLMEMEQEAGFDEKFKPHQTSFTLSNKDTEAGRPINDQSTNENTLQSKSNNNNAMPRPSD